MDPFGVTSTARTCCPTCCATHGDEIAAHVELPRRIIDNLGAIPSYYLRYYYQHDLVVAGAPGDRAAAPRRSWRSSEQLLQLYRDPQLHDKPELLMQRGGAYYSEAALNLLSVALRRERPTFRSLMSETTGSSRELPADAVIEVPAHVGSRGRGATPRPGAARRTRQG